MEKVIGSLWKLYRKCNFG